MVLYQVKYFEIGTGYGLKILHQWDKRIYAKSQKVLRINFYVCRSYREKTGKTGLLSALPIMNRVKDWYNRANVKMKTRDSYRDGKILSCC